MNFHVASRGGGSPLTLTFHQGGGSCLNCSDRIIKNNSSLASLARVFSINLLYLFRQANKFLRLYFCKCKSFSISGVLLL